MPTIKSIPKAIILSSLLFNGLLLKFCQDYKQLDSGNADFFAGLKTTKPRYHPNPQDDNYSIYFHESNDGKTKVQHFLVKGMKSANDAGLELPPDPSALSGAAVHEVIEMRAMR